MRDAATSREPVGAASASLAIFISACWGANPVAVSYSTDVVPPVAVAAIRFALATLVMFFWCRLLEKTTVTLGRHQLRPVLIAGVLLFFQIVTFNLGVWLSNSSHATLLINTFVFWVVAIEHFVTRTERLTLRKLLGLALAAISVVVIVATSPGKTTISTSDEPTLLGDLIMATSACILAIKIIYTKRALRQIESGRLIFWHNIVGVTLFTLTSLALETWSPSNLTAPAIAGLLYQGLIVAGLCFAIQAFLLRRHSPSQISVFSFSTPLFGIAAAILLRDDRFTIWLLVAGVLVAIGIVLVQWKEKEPVADV